MSGRECARYNGGIMFFERPTIESFADQEDKGNFKSIQKESGRFKDLDDEKLTNGGRISGA